MTNALNTFGGTATEKRPVWEAMKRGMMGKCPQCGEGKLFKSYVKNHDECAVCGQDFRGHRADDAPPYLTIMLVGHIIIPVALWVEAEFDPAMWVQFLAWLPILLISSWFTLPIAKGAMIGLQWANRMHGFGGPDADPKADA